mmetsp:Transcript_3808/g.10259  ORF Transcript_3808/g.10259 Transcript_3808/m.10259 type:complete len:217 (-) Transcript_3808:27-677(-)
MEHARDREDDDQHGGRHGEDEAGQEDRQHHSGGVLHKVIHGAVRPVVLSDASLLLHDHVGELRRVARSGDLEDEHVRAQVAVRLREHLVLVEHREEVDPRHHDADDKHGEVHRTHFVVVDNTDLLVEGLRVPELVDRVGDGDADAVKERDHDAELHQGLPSVELVLQALRQPQGPDLLLQRDLDVVRVRVRHLLRRLLLNFGWAGSTSAAARGSRA